MKKRLPLILLFIVFTMTVNADTNKYRLSLRDNPATSIVIGWNQVSGSDATVYYGTKDLGTNWNAYSNSKTVDRAVNYKGMNNRFARLTGLLPNTNYYFVLRDSQGTSGQFWFKTGSNNPSDRLSFIAGGDSRNNRTPRINANKLVAKLKPDAVLFGGDMTSGDSSSEWNTWFDDWQNTIASDGRMFPIVATRGNHEGSNNSIYNLFDVPSSSVYYAITFGGSLVRSYTLNTEISISGSQTSWLASDLQSNNTTWKIAQYHKPMRPHVSTKSEGNSQYNNWASLFYNNGVKLAIECDAHTVKTTWPVRPSTRSGSDEGFIRDNNNGTVYAGEGCWGAPLRTNNDSKAWTRNSGKFNQFKWIFVDQGKIEVRTIRVDNASQVGEVNNNNRFAIPSNLDVWNPSNGSVVTITGNLSSPICSITNPTNGQSYTTQQNITINANASDSDGNVIKVEFFVNGNSIGVDTTTPYSKNYAIPTDGAYTLTAVATDNDGITTTANAVNIAVGVVNQTINKRIASSIDDVEESGTNGSIYTDSSDLELVNDGLRGDQIIGLRFTGINIPQGATITNAYIQFTTDETSSSGVNLTIKGEAVNDASPFIKSTNNVSSRATTSTSVNWTPSAWNNVEAAGTSQRTPNIKSILQEIINRSGWNLGNDMTLIITGTGRRTAESYDGVPTSSPLIHIEYTIGGNGTPTNTTQIVDKRIANSMDDVEQNGVDGSMYTNSSDIELVNDGSRENQIIGLRFTGLDIPQSATITNAYIQFTTDETSSETTNLTIKGQDVNDAIPFSNSVNNVSSRITTSAFVNWNPLAWNRGGATGADQRTPNIKSIVQEIVNRSGWSAGNDMVMIITGTGKRTALSYDSSPNSAALIHIEYTIDGNSTPTNPESGSCDETQIDFNNFEVGYGIWNDGGTDCIRTSNTAYAKSGSYTIQLRDDSSSSFTNTDSIDLSSFDEVTVSFSYMCNSMDSSNEDFLLQISKNGGSTYTTIEEWNREDEFENNIRYNDTVIIQGPFTSSVRFRFVCDATSNGDQVYLDDISISACSINSNKAFKSSKSLITDDESINNIETDEVDSVDLEDITVSPNPFKNSLMIESSSFGVLKVNIKIYDINGKLIIDNLFNALGNVLEIKTDQLQNGLYVLKIEIGSEVLLKKIIKTE
ncbi:hypothetical protein A8C32_03075 [Flavivirga aquatica]|uniref:Fibronectin type-III domain-containing protein n=1 Tax=Flavivirga aquatica TaxID=1849968 RepID=A0A1E5TAS6_9FLAO|nr:Ig-like domain-containing protein [Flavivirga aquatica]OEK08446.1 hypothetical protein A8C32_03075 [Flavivirga aquatica]